MRSEPTRQHSQQAPGTPDVRGRASFAQTLKAVLWGVFGVRKHRDLTRDVASINPLYLILMAIGFAVLFVGGLLMLVDFILR